MQQAGGAPSEATARPMRRGQAEGDSSRASRSQAHSAFLILKSLPIFWFYHTREG